VKEFSLNLVEKLFYTAIFIFASLGVFNFLPPEFSLRYYPLVANWLTFLALFLGFFMNFYRAFILKPFRNNKFFFFLLFLSLIFFILAGQKISWGMEIMGDYIEHIFPKSIIIGIILLYFIVMPVLYRVLKKGKYWLDFWGVPIPKLFHLVLFILMGILVSKAPSPLSEILLEFGFSWIVILMIWRPYNRIIYSRSSLKR
jgi:hypothetical protein